MEPPKKTKVNSFYDWLNKWLIGLTQDPKLNVTSHISRLREFLKHKDQKTYLDLESFQDRLFWFCIKLNNIFRMNLSAIINETISILGLDSLKQKILSELQIGVRDPTNCLTELDLLCLYQALTELPRHLITKWIFKFDEIEGDTPRGEADGSIHLPYLKTPFQDSISRRFWEFPPIVIDGQETGLPVRQSFFYRMLLIRVFKHEIGHKVFGRALKHRYWPESKNYVGGEDNPWEKMKKMLYHPEVIYVYGLAHVLEDLATMFQAIATNALGVIHEAVYRASVGQSLYYSQIPGRTFRSRESNVYLLIKTIQTLSVFATPSVSSSPHSLSLTFNKVHCPPLLNFLQGPPMLSENGPVDNMKCESVCLTPNGCLEYVSWLNPTTGTLESIEVNQSSSSTKILLTGFSSSPLVIESPDQKFFQSKQSTL
ncbi:MAG: hypothetical protein ACFFBD_22640 [Candidatus Hodarchaeota archaeon]